ncbi:MAG: LolA family protein [Lysobacteraceae bacterium]
MKPSFFALLFAAAGATCASMPAQAQSAADALATFDKTTYSGRLDVVVSLYAPTGKPGIDGKPQQYPAQIVFERPDRYRLSLRPGQKNAFLAVAEAGIVRWIDYATGFSGKDATDAVTDPIAVALLGSAGEMTRYYAMKEQALPKESDVIGVQLRPRGLSQVQSGYAWLSRDGRPTGFDFRMTDGTRVFVAVLAFEQNAKTTPDDFQL